METERGGSAHTVVAARRSTRGHAFERLGAAAALLREPELAILDERANGLDPSGIREIRTLLRGLADRGGASIDSEAPRGVASIDGIALLWERAVCG